MGGKGEALETEGSSTRFSYSRVAGLNLLAVCWGYCTYAPLSTSDCQTIRMLLPLSGCTESHPRPHEWPLPSIHPVCPFLLRFCSYPCWPQPPPASIQVWVLMAGTERARRRKGQGWSLESGLLGYEPMPDLE